MKTTGWFLWGVFALSAKAVKSSALTFESVDNVERGDGLAAGVLSVGHGVANHVLKKCTKYAARLVVDQLFFVLLVFGWKKKNLRWRFSSHRLDEQYDEWRAW